SGRSGGEHDQRLRRNPLGQRIAAPIPVRKDAEPNRREDLGGSDEGHRELADFFGGSGDDAAADPRELRGRRGDVVSGAGVVPFASPFREGSLPVELQRGGSRLAKASHAEGLHGSDAAIFRSFPERHTGSGLDAEGDFVFGSRAGERKD